MDHFRRPLQSRSRTLQYKQCGLAMSCPIMLLARLAQCCWVQDMGLASSAWHHQDGPVAHACAIAWQECASKRHTNNVWAQQYYVSLRELVDAITASSCEALDALRSFATLLKAHQFARKVGPKEGKFTSEHKLAMRGRSGHTHTRVLLCINPSHAGADC